MTSRMLLTTIGATALALGVSVGGGSIFTPAAAAQETGATTTTTATTAQNAPVDHDIAAYRTFVIDLARRLNSKPAAVDAAIRDVLKQQVDEQEAGGRITREAAASMKAAIDASQAPLDVEAEFDDDHHRNHDDDDDHYDVRGRDSMRAAHARAEQETNQTQANERQTTGNEAAPGGSTDWTWPDA